MINVLISAYAVSPSWGSEPGMGWNWIINIAKYCNVFVITEGEWKEEILIASEDLPQRKNLHFFFNPVSPKIRKMCWNQGDWRFYWYYRKWQRKTLRIAKEIISTNKIDILHQLNMVGFREPGYLWKLKELPLVWGPIGGMCKVPVSYINDTDLKNRLFFNLKNIINDFQFKYHPRVRKCFKSSNVIAATLDTQQSIEAIYKKDVPLINETGTSCSPDLPSRNYSDSASGNQVFRVIWVGRFIFTKRLDIALKSVAKANNKNIQLIICGTGEDKEISKYKCIASTLGIENQVVWKGKVDHSCINALMRESDLLFFTSIIEATSTVILEAVSAGLPILSFNTCGFGPIVKDFAGRCIELSTPEDSVYHFAKELNYLESNRKLLSKYTEQEHINIHTLSWEHKGQLMNDLYNSILKR